MNSSFSVFVVPKLSKYDFLIFRLGGHGLCNLLFTWARAYCISYLYKYQLVWPTWTQFCRRPLLNLDTDKRIYHNFFKRTNYYISSIYRIYAFLFCFRTFSVRSVSDVSILKSEISTNSSLIVRDESNSFSDIYAYRGSIRNAFFEMLNPKLSIPESVPLPDVAVHIRLGDFKVASRQSPISYYESIIKCLIIDNPSIRISIFTDEPLNTDVQRLCRTYSIHINLQSSPLIDLMLISAAKIVVAAPNSTFSYWGFFFRS